MSTLGEDHILREQRPGDSLVPALNRSLELSEKQIRFLLHAMRDVDPEAVDAEAAIRKRIVEVQNTAYQVYPYPCIYTFRHVSLLMAENSAFTHVLKARQVNAPWFIDVGCCMGTDLRYLVRAGYPPTCVIGCDVRRDFIDLGYELFGDRNSSPIPFFVGDIFDVALLPFPQMADNTPLSLKDVRDLNELRGRVKYVYAGSVFHLFDEGTQEAIARRLATLLDVSRSNGPAVLFGRHVAKAEEGIIDDELGRTRYAHSPSSWKGLWGRVLGDKIRVHVSAEFRSCDENRSAWNPGRGTHMMWWSVWVG